MRLIIFKTFILIFMISVLILPVFAQSYTLLEPLPGRGKWIGESGGDVVLTGNITLSQYLQWLFNFALIATGFLAVLMIVIGGVEFMIGGANESMRKEGKNRISNALWGLLLALGAWLIIYTINPELVKLDFDLPAAKIQLQGENSKVKDSRVDIISKDSVKDCQQKIFDQNPGKGPEDLFDQLVECDKLKDAGGLKPPQGN